MSFCNLDQLEEMSLQPIFRNNPIRSHVCDPFAMDIWDPFGDFNDRHTISASHPPFHKSIPTPFAGVSWTEWEETTDTHVLRAAIPGLGKEDITVQVEEGKLLEISGKKEVEKEEKHENLHHFERREEKFFSAVSLPENCRHDHIRSSWDNGVLTVTVPKRDVMKSHVKKNHVKG